MAPKLTARQKVERDETIIADRMRGFTFRTLAARHGLDERQCRRIVKEHRAEAIPGHDWVEEAYDQLDQATMMVEQLAIVAENASNDAIKLGALKAQVIAMRERRELMQQIGFLPKDLGLVPHMTDLEKIVDSMVDVFDKYGLGEEAEDELLRRLDAVSPGRKPATRNGQHGSGGR